MNILVLRLKAFLIDYVVIAFYIGLLLGITLLLSHLIGFSLSQANPFIGELVGLLTLTLPVILYFMLMKNGKYAASLGKRHMRLAVKSNNSEKATFVQLLIRNVVKFLPWELAHFFIIQMFAFINTGRDVPSWVLAGLIVSQAFAILYVVTLLVRRDNRSMYEIVSKTKVERVE